MKELTCILRRNDCWKKYHDSRLAPVGIVVHSTDKAGGVLRRFVQPAPGQTEGLAIDGRPAGAAQLLAVLGQNPYGNDWNRPGLRVCVHAFLGRTADGAYAACKTLDYTQPCWGAGSGKNGSCNGCQNGRTMPPLYIQFEMIEDERGDPAHARALYELALRFCAARLREFPQIRLGDVISHREAYLRGMASDHGDPESWWKRCGLPFTMDGFRAELKRRMEEERDMTREETAALIDEKLEKAVGKFIERIGDVPDADVRAELRQLLDCGAINGGTPYGQDPDDVRLPYDVLRAIIVSKRYTDQKTGG